MIHPDGSERFPPQGRPDHLRRESPDGLRGYHEGRPDHLWWEQPDGGRRYYNG